MKTNRLPSWLSCLFAFLALAAVGLSARATPPPETGIWWNANQSGRGFVIEVQDQYLMISAYAYDADGEPMFVLSSGTMSSTTFYSGTVLRTSNGQCFNCPYRAPSSTPVGTVTINFTSPWSANMTFLGEYIQIKRFDVTDYLEHVPDVMFGEWVTNEGSSTLASWWGERLKFTSTYYSASGTRYISGYRTGNTSDIALADWDANTQTIIILLDSSASYYQMWKFSYLGFNRLEGTNYTFLKSSSPGSGLAGVANRMNYRSGPKWIASASTSTKTASAQTIAENDESNRKRAAVAAQSASAADLNSTELGRVRALASELEIYRAQVRARGSIQ